MPLPQPILPAKMYIARKGDLNLSQSWGECLHLYRNRASESRANFDRSCKAFECRRMSDEKQENRSIRHLASEFDVNSSAKA